MNKASCKPDYWPQNITQNIGYLSSRVQVVKTENSLSWIYTTFSRFNGFLSEYLFGTFPETVKQFDRSIYKVRGPASSQPEGRPDIHTYRE